MSYTARIMNLQAEVPDEVKPYAAGVYQAGHRDARHAAAEIAAEADARLEVAQRMAEALKEARALLADASACVGIGSPDAALKWWARKGDVGAAALAEWEKQQ